MVRTSASDEVDLSSIPESGQTEDFRKLVLQLPCLEFSIKRDSVEKKSASLLVASCGEALNGILPILNSRQLDIINRTDTPMQ